MIFWRFVGVALACAPLLLAPARAQEGSPQPGTQQPGAQHPGRSVVMSKCFQCHTDAMFRDQRQDRRGWEAAIYRMVGRGGLWTADEIKLMADYLGSEFGPKASSTQTPATQTR
jgi:mono/diheme cytochrome c family protein